ncbi:MAG: DUF4265 domain-containing protein [Dysgonomonas sp.]
METEYQKVVFELEVDEDGYPPVGFESVWTIKERDYYIVDNIPFYIHDISLGDKIIVKENNGELRYLETIEKSRNSTIRIICSNDNLWEEIINFLNLNNCSWESDKELLETINIPFFKRDVVIDFFEYLEKIQPDFEYEYGAIRE